MNADRAIRTVDAITANINSGVGQMGRGFA